MMTRRKVELPEGLVGLWDVLGMIEQMATAALHGTAIDNSATLAQLGVFDELRPVRQTLQIVLMACADMRSMVEDKLGLRPRLGLNRLLTWFGEPHELDQAAAELMAETESLVLLPQESPSKDEDPAEAQRAIRRALRFVTIYLSVVDGATRAGVRWVDEAVEALSPDQRRWLHAGIDLALLATVVLLSTLEQRLPPSAPEAS